MRHISLFSGIGGFDLAAEWVGWENVAQVEIDPFCLKVLEKNFPNTKRYHDIKDFKTAEYSGTIDVISGGFPCQPFSLAGKRAGKKDDRHLWPEMFRVISEIRPQWVVAENVPGILSIEYGLVFEQVCIDLESIGYEIQSVIIPAAARNAPHQRKRLWFIANAKGKGLERNDSTRTPQTKRRAPQHDFTSDWIKVASELCRVDDGVPKRLDKSNRLKALGNAIVPQIAYEIFNAINNV